MNLFRRIFKIGQAEAHSLVDQLEDPIKLTEQGIRDMKTDLDKSIQALAEVKAMAIRARQEAEQNKQKASEYEQKAMQLLERAEQSLIDPAEADRLATIALTKKEECAQQALRASDDMKKFEASITTLDANIKKLRANISKWENEAKTLKARAKVSEATKNVNKALSQVDGSGTVAMLEKMKEKVAKDEALAESYAQIADESKTVDEEIDKVLGSTNTSSTDALAALKAKMAQSKSI